MSYRSLLYVPADNQKFIEKAHLRGADAIILDLEDAVRQESKPQARQNLMASVKLCQQSGADIFVRINTQKTEAFKDTEAGLLAGATGLYVPKARAKRLRQLHKFLRPLEKEYQLPKLSFVALIEDAKGVLQAQEIASQKRVIGLSLGAEDLANNIGATPDADVLRLPKQLVHLAAKSKGLMSFGLFRSVANYSETSEIEAAALEAKRFGFDGASCVHPSAVAILNKAFQPSNEELEWAQAVLQKAATSRGGAFAFDGKMVDAPLLARAEKIVARFAKNR